MDAFHLTPHAGGCAGRWRPSLCVSCKSGLARVVDRLGGRLAGNRAADVKRSCGGCRPAAGAALRHIGRRCLPAKGRDGTCALLIGCAATAVPSSPQTTLATAGVAEDGCEVWVPRGQGCCGALALPLRLRHAVAVALASATCAAFGQGTVIRLMRSYHQLRRLRGPCEGVTAI